MLSFDGSTDGYMCLQHFRFAAVRFEFPCNADITYVYIASLDILTEDGEYEYLRYLDTDQMTFRERIERWKWAADNVQEEA